MTETLKRVILTGENEQIVPLTAEEIALIEESKKATAVEKAAIEAAQTAKDAALAKLSALGLDLDDLKALGF